MAIMDVMTDTFPDAISAEGVRGRLLRQKRRLSFQAVKSHLDLYCALGKLEHVGEDYRALAQMKLKADDGGEERAELLGLRITGFRRICESYVRGDVGACFGSFRGEMDAECLAAARQELQAAVEEIISKYIALTRSKEASGSVTPVKFSGLLAMGQIIGEGPWEEPPCDSPTTTREPTPSLSGSSSSSASSEGPAGEHRPGSPPSQGAEGGGPSAAPASPRPPHRQEGR